MCVVCVCVACVVCVCVCVFDYLLFVCLFLLGVFVCLFLCSFVCVVFGCCMCACLALVDFVGCCWCLVVFGVVSKPFSRYMLDKRHNETISCGGHGHSCVETWGCLFFPSHPPSITSIMPASRQHHQHDGLGGDIQRKTFPRKIVTSQLDCISCIAASFTQRLSNFSSLGRHQPCPIPATHFLKGPRFGSHQLWPPPDKP